MKAAGLAVGGAGLSGCAAMAGEPHPMRAQVAQLAAPVNLKFVTWPKGSGTAAYGPLIADALKAGLPAGSAVTVDFGSPDKNLDSVSKGEADLGLTYSMTAKAAKQANLRAIAAGLDRNYVFVWVLADLGITAIEQIKGRKIRIITTKDAGYDPAELLLKEYGIGYADLTVRGGSATMTKGGGGAAAKEVAEAVKANAVDMAIQRVNPDHTGMMMQWFAFTGAAELRFLPVDVKVIRSMREKYGYIESLIPKGVFRGVNEDLPAVGVGLALFTRAELPNEVAFVVTKALAENKDRLIAVGPDQDKAMRFFRPEAAWKDTFLPLHPGAAAYYRSLIA